MTTTTRERVGRWVRDQASAYRGEQPRPLSGYIGAMAVYSGMVGAAGSAAWLSGRHGPERVTPWDVALLGLATHKLSRLLSKDAVTSPLRAPFVRYQEPGAPAEVNEEVREHGGAKHTMGELSTCPFCLAQWVATALVAGWVLAPRLTRLASATLAGVAASDWLQMAYAALERVATD